MQQIVNPAFWQDFPDIDVLRVGDTYYASASSFHLSPGAPVLRSYDLVHWEVAGHSVPRLADFGPKYAMEGGTGYVRGIWASFLGYRPSNRTFYWGGQTDFATTHLYTATDVAGPWRRHAVLDASYYDAGLLVDDDDTMYVAYGNTEIRVAQLSPDATSVVRDEHVLSTPPEIGVLEGARMYRRGDAWYVWLTRPANGQYVLRSTAGPFGPYELREVLLDLPGPIEGGGVPHQGGLVTTPDGDWYYQAFVDAYPGGRVPVIAPVTWTDDGWPELVTVDGRWAREYPAPAAASAPREVAPMVGPDDFRAPVLGPRWQWNHDPDPARFRTGEGLRLETATVTDDLYRARNTLTHRTVGPCSTATVELDVADLHAGDRTGLAVLRDSSAWVGVVDDGGARRVVVVDGLAMGEGWTTVATGAETASADLTTDRVWLRAEVDVRPGPGREALFSWSTDGATFTRIGAPFVLEHAWQFFLGYRYGIFAHATRALGGAVTVERFDLTTSD